MLGWLKRFFASVFLGSDRGFSVDQLASRLGVNATDLETADRSYREFQIKKKSGGLRQIAEPNRELKRLQRLILRRLLAGLKTHPLATGFQPGVSFIDNARCHEYQAVVIRIDLVDFFPSISRDRIEQYFRTIGWKSKPARILTDLTTHRGVLPQGAPTSPRLSNLVNYLLDHNLAKLASRFDAVYTRYADDITLSLNGDSDEVAELLGRTLTMIHQAGYRTHKGKKRFRVLRSHHRQLVTGLVVNEGAKLPRETRRWLRAVEHRMALEQQPGYLGDRPTLTREQLQGWRALQQKIALRKN